jgi:CheY-like chemotaxis protein
VAHDFNNLLTVILGNSELLLTNLDRSDPRRIDVENIQRATASAAGLTRRLLAFSRKQIIEPTLFDLNVLLADMRAMITRLVREDVTVVFAPGRGQSPIKADRGQVEQLLMNLTANARDAMPGVGTLTIETSSAEVLENDVKPYPLAAPGWYVVLTITDTGTGMTPEVQAHLFEPFFSTKDLGKGTGLGLAAVHGIVSASGGGVSVDSAVGRGTTLRVYFPQADATEILLDRRPPAALAHRGVETVLVVDDVDSLRQLTRRLLQRLGYTVLTAADADEAILLFEHAPIDVVLTDVVMPGASGPELMGRLLELRPALKVIYMSGYTEDAFARNGMIGPGVAFLSKPFTSESLGRKIRETLDCDSTPPAQNLLSLD